MQRLHSDALEQDGDEIVSNSSAHSDETTSKLLRNDSDEPVNIRHTDLSSIVSSNADILPMEPTQSPTSQTKTDIKAAVMGAGGNWEYELGKADKYASERRRILLEYQSLTSYIEYVIQNQEFLTREDFAKDLMDGSKSVPVWIL